MFATGKKGTTWYDRGDPSVTDFDHGDLTKDNAWHTLSFSGIVPVGTKVVKLRLYALVSNASQLIRFRTKGNSNQLNSAAMNIQVANVTNYADLEVWLNTALEIEYKTTAVAWLSIGITVASYGR